MGSPPLARGIPDGWNVIPYRFGITPACAGNTEQMKVNAGPRWDHPRLRGEYYENKERKLKTEGSPPLARGILKPLNA